MGMVVTDCCDRQHEYKDLTRYQRIVAGLRAQKTWSTEMAGRKDGGDVRLSGWSTCWPGE